MKIAVVANNILRCNPQTVGIYRLAMKAGFDNFALAASRASLGALKPKGGGDLDVDEFFRSRVVSDFHKFMPQEDMVVANRLDNLLRPMADKVYTRDLFGQD